MNGARERRAVAVHGIVQGVGFRPFIFTLARRFGLVGYVRNAGDGVTIEVEGDAAVLDHFLAAIRDEAPALALIEEITWMPTPTRAEEAFRIDLSQDGAPRQTLISPDVATCPACLAEMLDPCNRRYRYPFTNCTNCGPRFTITRGIPYDRCTTTMAGFPLCTACQREYTDPADRRFHAQPNACPICGPQVALLDCAGQTVALMPGVDAIATAARWLREGAIVAIKGLGGYHIACNPFIVDAVRTLRARKGRQAKPFALMAQNLTQAQALCHISAAEERILTSPARPIVVLDQRADNGIADEVAPRQTTLGVMLAYTPLHHLLLRDAGMPLVMTSGNQTDEPIAYRDEEALAQLGAIVDYFIVHNRPIHMRCDDSVTRFVLNAEYPSRRSRGYAPRPLTVTEPFTQHVLACGGELKSTFALARDHHVFMSHHIGDLENYATLRSYREGIRHFSELFAIEPALVAYDLHPEYLSTKYAHELEEDGLTAIGIQHHHAHIASCLADNQRPTSEMVIGIALDGTGYGLDGAIWGGEVFTGSLNMGFTRRAHLAYIPMPGGAAAIREPWRMAMAHMLATFGLEATLRHSLPLVKHIDERQIRVLDGMIAQQINSPLSSSAGRLFDAVAALADLPGTRQITYEGQAAIELEIAAGGTSDQPYPFDLRAEGPLWILETREIIMGVVADLAAGGSAGRVAARFHATLAAMVAATCQRIRAETGINVVAVSGGALQNRLLLEQLASTLGDQGFTLYRHQRVPTNDGGLALGQAVLAATMARRGAFQPRAVD